MKKTNKKSEIILSNKTQVSEDRNIEKFTHNGASFYIKTDGHEGKHLNCGDIKKNTLKKWGDRPATFNPDFVHNYKQKLKEVITVWSKSSDRSKTAFIESESIVGWDKGEPTNIIELYYGGELGSHMRPKVIDQKTETPIIKMKMK